MCAARPAAEGGPRRSWLTGVAATVLGGSLVLRLAASSAGLVLALVLGFAVLALGVCSESFTRPLLARSEAAARVVAAVALSVVGWTGGSLRTVGVVVGVALLVDGGLTTVDALRDGTGRRLPRLADAVAALLPGVLLLAWPGTTLTGLSVAFGARLLWFGVIALWPRRSAYAVRTGGTLAVVVAVLAVSTRVNAGVPTPDAFYTPPAHVPARPGRLLRAEPFTRALPPGSRAWRILYTTTRAPGRPTVASALVVTSAHPPPGPRPVIAWAHGSTGYAVGCAPSLMPDPLPDGSPPALSQVLRRGWVLVAPDYPGLGTAGPQPFLIGAGEGRSVLDAVRAVHQLPGLDLAHRTVVWGHSQGGNAGLWAGELARAYAPDDHVVGVAGLAPTSSVQALVDNVPHIAGGGVFAAYLAQAYSDTYPDVRFDSYVRPEVRILVREIAARCQSDKPLLVSGLVALLLGRSIWARSPDTGPLGRRLRQNAPDGPVAAPLFIGQGTADEVILPASQRRYVALQCHLGSRLEYRQYPGLDHVGLVTRGSPAIPDLLAWTQARLAGRPAPSTC